MKNAWLALVVIITASIVAGCGGGGGSVAPTPMNVRQIQPGDMIGYESIYQDEDGRTHTSYGFDQFSESDRIPIYGNRVLLNAYYELGSLPGSQVGIPDFTDLALARKMSESGIEQAADGTVFRSDGKLEDDPLPTITAAPVWYPSPPAVGQTYSYTLTSEDRISETSVRVVACGAKDGYMAYRIHKEIHMSGSSVHDNINLIDDEWFVPELGCVIRSECYDPSQPSRRTISKMIYKNF